jgi:hypothetical protein
MKTKILLFVSGVIIWIDFRVCAQPNSAFLVNRYNICSGTTLLLDNISNGANSYEWLLQNIDFSFSHYSYCEDTIVTLIEPCYRLQQIKLIATDTLTGFYDSSSIVVEVFDTCFFHWHGTFNRCTGDTIILSYNPEEIATQFIFSESIVILNGCLTCPSIEFILINQGTLVDRKSTYFGGCTELTSFDYICNSIDIRENEENQNERINIFPNPFSSSTTIIFKTAVKNAELRIYDIYGHEIKRIENIFGQEIELSRYNLINGIYYIRLTEFNKIIATGKIIITD